jgi:calcineurin-like phosphoesterase family protein
LSENRFITSDLHLGHRNILKYDGRPFHSIGEHDDVLISNWNEVVLPKDRVYCLGDIVWYSDKEKVIEVLNRLNGKIHLIRGNHDRMVDKPGVRERFDTIENLTILRFKKEGVQVPGGKLYLSLCHYAMHRWINSHRPDSFHLYGHSHGQLTDQRNMSFDAGIMNTAWYPMPWEVMISMMKKRIEMGYGPTEHHE